MVTVTGMSGILAFCMSSTFFFSFPPNLLNGHADRSVKKNWIGYMIPVVSPLVFLWICKKATCKWIAKHCLAPARSDIIFSSCAYDGGKIFIIIQKHFDFAFTPPGISIYRVGIDANIYSKESAMTVHFW